MSTTYYFTVCSYVTNIGNGTSYNVNAKTKGVIIADVSTRYSVFDDLPITDAIAQQGYISFGVGSKYKTISTANILSSCTKLIVQCKELYVSNGKYRWAGCQIRTLGSDGLYNTNNMFRKEFKAVTTYTNETITYDISSLPDHPYGITMCFGFGSESSTGFVTGNISFTYRILKIWAE